MHELDCWKVVVCQGFVYFLQWLNREPQQFCCYRVDNAAKSNLVKYIKRDTYIHCIRISFIQKIETKMNLTLN